MESLKFFSFSTTAPEERREKIAAELKAQEDEKRAKYKEKIEKAKAKARAKAAAKAGKAEL